MVMMAEKFAKFGRSKTIMGALGRKIKNNPVAWVTVPTAAQTYPKRLGDLTSSAIPGACVKVSAAVGGAGGVALDWRLTCLGGGFFFEAACAGDRVWRETQLRSNTIHLMTQRWLL
jgi:hypothetical protein